MGITSLMFVIPNSVTSIGDCAFYSCSGLTSITIPNSVTSIGNLAFEDCIGIIDIYNYANAVPKTSSNIFNNVKINKATLHVPASAIDAYRTTAPWSDFGNIVAIEGTAEKETYAVLTDDGTLTFYYDNQKGKRSGTSYELNTGTNKPGWYDNRANITKAVFDASFADARPITTYSWFYGAKNMKSIEGIKNLNTSNVTSMSGMFEGCSGLTNIDVRSFNTSNVTDMGGMFNGCSGLTSLDLSNFNTSNVTSSGHMFNGCSGLTSLDLSSFNTSNVTNMWYMFNGCSGLTSIDVSSFDTSNVTNMYAMFDNCSSLTSIDLSSFNTSKVTDMSYMFQFCNSLTSLDLSSFNTSNVTNMTWMFYGCSSLTSLDLSSFNTSNVKDMDCMFYGCSSLTSLDLSSFNTSNVTNMSYMFYDCWGLNSLDVSNFDTSNVTDMSWMFSFCGGLTSLDLSSFDTSNVTNMTLMFQLCSGLKTIICSDKWTTENVEYSEVMFSLCTNLVGGAGTKYNSEFIDKTYAHVDGGPSNPGYLTLKGGEEDDDDLQRYLDSLFDTEDEFVNNVYRREFQNDDWQSLYVPFTVSSSDWSTNFDVARISGLSKKGDSQVLEATVIESGNLQANYPYLIRAKSKSGATLTMNVSSSTQATNSMNFGGVTITGNYSQLKGLKSARRYRMQGGAFSIPGSDEEVLQPYRWYMTIDNPAARELLISINGDEVTGIEDVEHSSFNTQRSTRPKDACKARTFNVYTPSGRRIAVSSEAEIESLPKGIYLIDNKKRVIK